LAGHIAGVREMSYAKKFWSETVKGRDHVEKLDVDGRTISR